MRPPWQPDWPYTAYARSEEHPSISPLIIVPDPRPELSPVLIANYIHIDVNVNFMSGSIPFSGPSRLKNMAINPGAIGRQTVGAMQSAPAPQIRGQKIANDEML
ncbi:MAG TPA: hypothetical protein VN047_15115 [Sphingopyxis sp.]|uniref:hypothetical protein n=1 Tax=Sphingopyxis sp. TaxID=1908224 RepID=UPI002C32BA2A|nr:hypothetical protein [Sphingopyxis sp.]HWW58221.1 hypothetical protein [Sphingopyxis sp.]